MGAGVSHVHHIPLQLFDIFKDLGQKVYSLNTSHVHRITHFIGYL